MAHFGDLLEEAKMPIAVKQSQRNAQWIIQMRSKQHGDKSLRARCGCRLDIIIYVLLQVKNRRFQC